MSIDLKDHETLIPVNQNHHHRYPMDSGSESAFIGSWSSSSSSSFLTTSFGSELDSNDADLDDGGDGDEDEFIAQLTRQMADYMLEENDDTEGDVYQSSKNSSFPKRNLQEPEQSRRSYADTVKKSIGGLQPEPEQSVTKNEQLQSPIQLYQVENQPRVSGRGRKGKMSESIQQMKPHRHEQKHGSRSLRGNKEFGNGGKGYSGVQGPSMVVGSGMRAIFLGGPGSRDVMSGTGVFLPRSSTDATDHSRKKPGCSTVLVPTRVLQALEQHFTNIGSLSRSPESDSLAPRTHHVNKDNAQTQEAVSVDHQDSRLPQDWIY